MVFAWYRITPSLEFLQQYTSAKFTSEGNFCWKAASNQCGAAVALKLKGLSNVALIKL
jgi:hypothetical protein